jgi:transposase
MLTPDGESPEPPAELDPHLARALDNLIPNNGPVEREALRLALQNEYGLAYRKRALTRLVQKHGYHYTRVSANPAHYAGGSKAIFWRG